MDMRVVVHRTKEKLQLLVNPAEEQAKEGQPRKCQKTKLNRGVLEAGLCLIGQRPRGLLSCFP